LLSLLKRTSGEIIGASQVRRDQTRVRRALRDAFHLSAIVDSSDDAIVSKDLNGIVMSWNSAAERMFGFTADEMIGRSIRLVIPPDRQAEEDDVLAHIRRGERVEHYETVRQRKDGTRLSISLTVSPILRDETGRVVGASKIARDVTERVQMEAAAREHAANTATLGEMGALVASTLDRQAITLRVAEVATALTHAQWGAFAYSERDREGGDESMHYSVSRAPRDAVAQFLKQYPDSPLVHEMLGEAHDEVRQPEGAAVRTPGLAAENGRRSAGAKRARASGQRRVARRARRLFFGHAAGDLLGATRAARRGHCRLGVDRARECAALRRSERGEPLEG
jgi:PAS domain S-box-containing protein